MIAAVSSAEVETALLEWEDGHRRLEAEAQDRDRYERLRADVDAVTAELRRRVGETFTLSDLAREYASAERWTRDAVGESATSAGWVRTLATVEGAAFYRYARGAVDYTP